MKQISTTSLRKIIQSAQEAELRRDDSASQQALNQIWPNINSEPDFSLYTPLDRARLLRLAGFFLSNHGKAKNIASLQERGKNLLSESIAIFDELGESELSADANIALALSYFYEGSILESEIILETLAYRHKHNLGLTYLRICANRLLVMQWKGEFDKAISLIEEIKIPMEFCDDLNLNCVFHTQSGIIYKSIDDTTNAIYHYQEAIKFGEKSEAIAVIAKNKNNLANLYRKNGNHLSAHQFIDEAISICKSNKNNGWLANFLDTKSLIYFDEGKFEHALATISESIELFRKGEDAAGLTEALWNKVRCLIELKDKEEALYVFAEVTELARKQIGEFGLRKFIKELTKIFHGKGSGTFEEEIQRFKRMEIEEALSKADNDIAAAANLLKISEAKLIRMISSEFPDLFKEKQDAEQAYKPVAEPEAESGLSPANKFVSALELNVNAFAFAPELNVAPDSKPLTFYIAAEKMELAFGLAHDAVIAALPINDIPTGEYLVLESLQKNSYYLSRLSYDKSLDFHMLIDEETPLTLGDVNIVGRAIGYIPFEEIDSDTLNFRPLPQ